MLAKSISTATGLVAYDLQAPAKNLYPFVTPIRNVMPRVGGGTGTATNWRQVNAIIGSGFDAMGWVPEGQRSGQMSLFDLEQVGHLRHHRRGRRRDLRSDHRRPRVRRHPGADDLSPAAKDDAERGDGDPRRQRLAALGTPATPTLSASGAGATLPAGTYFVKVVALTLEGYQNSSVSGGVATTKTVTGVDNKTFTLSGGSSNISAEASQAVTLGQTLFCSVTPIQGAVAYAWYISTSTGTETLQAITTINSLAVSAPLATGNQPQTAITTDNSANPSYAYDGLLTTALKAGSNAYVNTMPTGTAGTGTALTASGRGSVVEIDTMFQTMWNNFELSPTVLYVNAQELKNITTKVLSNSSGPLLRYDTPADGSEGEYQLTASGVVQFYYNPFAIYGGLRIPIKIHPRVPPGTIIGWAENLPIQYQSNEVPNVAEIKTRQDYYQIDWPIVTRQRQVGVYAEEVLAVYAPFAMGVITNITNG